MSNILEFLPFGRFFLLAALASLCFSTSSLVASDDTDAWGEWRTWSICSSMDCMKGTRSRIMMCENKSGAYSEHGCQDSEDEAMTMVKLEKSNCPVCNETSGKDLIYLERVTMDGLMNLRCPFGYSIWKVDSRWHFGQSDRVWNVICRKSPRTIPLQNNCTCSEYVNSLHESFVYECPENGAITGMSSKNRNGLYEDRTFKFACCPRVSSATEPAMDCSWSELTGFQMDFVTVVPRNHILSGIESKVMVWRWQNAMGRHNLKCDRMYRFKFCKAIKGSLRKHR